MIKIKIKLETNKLKGDFKRSNEKKEFENIAIQSYPIDSLDNQDLTMLEFYGISHANNIDGKYKGTKIKHETLVADLQIVIPSEYVVYVNEDLNKAQKDQIDTFDLTKCIIDNNIPVVDIEIGYN